MIPFNEYSIGISHCYSCLWWSKYLPLDRSTHLLGFNINVTARIRSEKPEKTSPSSSFRNWVFHFICQLWFILMNWVVLTQLIRSVKNPLESNLQKSQNAFQKYIEFFLTWKTTFWNLHWICLSAYILLWFYTENQKG